jgi:hypothetical protein
MPEIPACTVVFLPRMWWLRKSTELIILPTMSESTLSLNCFILGGDSSEVFTVKIPKTDNVSILKRLIKEEQSPRFNDVVASTLTTWKVSLPVDAITPEFTVDGVEPCEKLQSVKKISSIFGEALVDEHVHVLVQAPTGAIHKLFLDSADLAQGHQPRTRAPKRLRGADESEELQHNPDPHVVSRHFVKRRRLSLLEGSKTIYQAELDVRLVRPFRPYSRLLSFMCCI